MHRSLPILILALSLPPLAGATPLRGDATKGERLYRMECAACHGSSGMGSELWKRTGSEKTPPRLGDSAFLATRSDSELHAAMSTGHGKDAWIPGHAFTSLSTLDRWDIIQFLRERSLSVATFFPQAVKFTAKSFTIDEYGVDRLGEVDLDIGEADRDVVVLTVYKGERKANEPLRLIPWNPVDLDLLDAGDRLGFLSFVDLEAPRTGERLHVGLAFGADGTIQRVGVRHPDPKQRAAYEQILSSFVGQKARGAAKIEAPRGLRDGAAWAKELTRAASLAGEGILMYEKAERARTAFDR